MRAFGIIGLWIRSLLVGPLGFVIVFLAGYALVLRLCRRKKATNVPPCCTSLLLAFGGIFLLLCLPYPAVLLGFPLRWLASRIERKNPVVLAEDADLQRGIRIVVFGGGVLGDGVASPSTLQRIEGAVQLWRKMPEAGIVLSEGGIGAYGGTDWFRAYFRRLGVPEERLTLEPCARSTRENAVLVAKLCMDTKVTSVILVTSWSHLPRSYLAARRCGLAPRVAAVGDFPGRLTFCPTWRSLFGFWQMLNEYVGIAGYKLLGWA
jgi:uncharacterized SAM-binding protein YcdF (DUF218 family)